MSWWERLSSAVSGQPPVDPEIKAAEARNALRAEALAMIAEKEELMAQRTTEHNVYTTMLRECRGSTSGPYWNHAAAAFQTVRQLDAQIASIDAMLAPINNVLHAAASQKRNDRVNQLLNHVVDTHAGAPGQPSREQRAATLHRASELVADNEAHQRDMSQSMLTPVVDNSAFQQQMLDDMAAMHAPSAASSSPLSSSSSSSVSDATRAAGMAAALRSNMQAPAWAKSQ